MFTQKNIRGAVRGLYSIYFLCRTGRLRERTGRTVKMLSRLAARHVRALPTAVQGSQTMSTLLPGYERRSIPMDPSPCRLVFVPESWFQFFYPKTGVTGPYTFGGSVMTYLLSKEIWILEHEFYTGCSILIMAAVIYTKFGDKIGAWLDKLLEKEDKEMEDARISNFNMTKEMIEHEKKQQWRSEIQKLIIDAKKENIAVQLEAAYRERMSLIVAEVKKRLDYQTQIAAVERRLAQRHMAQWIINNVRKSITPEQEKASLQQCIKDLQAMAPRG